MDQNTCSTTCFHTISFKVIAAGTPYMCGELTKVSFHSGSLPVFVRSSIHACTTTCLSFAVVLITEAFYQANQSFTVHKPYRLPTQLNLTYTFRKKNIFPEKSKV